MNAACRSTGMLLEAIILFACIRQAVNVIFLSSLLNCGVLPNLRLSIARAALLAISSYAPCYIFFCSLIYLPLLLAIFCVCTFYTEASGAYVENELLEEDIARSRWRYWHGKEHIRKIPWSLVCSNSIDNNINIIVYIAAHSWFLQTKKFEKN